MLERIHKLLEARSKGFVFSMAVFLLLLINYIDHLTGTYISMGVFYLVPVTVVAWRVRKPFWFPFCVAAAVAWGFVNYQGGVSALIAGWNGFTRLGIFSIVGFLTAELREMLDHEATLSRTDYLTGANNKRAFMERAGLELQRMRRHPKPLSLAYIDLDNFKSVNDEWGHGAGDELLRMVVEIGRSNLRQTDLLARMGGDEFVVLLPETDAQDAYIVLEKLKALLAIEARRRAWPIGLSIGIVTFPAPLSSVDEMLHRADELMYSVKSSGKGRTEQLTYTEPQRVKQA